MRDFVGVLGVSFSFGCFGMVLVVSTQENIVIGQLIGFWGMGATLLLGVAGLLGKLS